MSEKSFCGMCGTAQFILPLSDAEKVPYFSFSDPKGLRAFPKFLRKHIEQSSPSANIYIVGKVSDVPAVIVSKFNRLAVEHTEVMLQQWGCPKCETIHSYWYRKDGKEGDLFRLTKDRQRGKGIPLAEVPGSLKDY